MNLLRPICKFINRWTEKIQCFVTVFILTPGFFMFEMGVVRPALVEVYDMGTMKHLMHVILPTYLYLNINFNMLFSITTNTKLKASSDSGEYCAPCKMIRPAGAWHCKTCNACILRRDHHCLFFSRCIGLYNQRYFVSYLGYILLSMVYSTYYNYYYVCLKFDNHSIFVSLIRIVNPFFRFIVRDPMGTRDLYVLFLIMNVALLFWSSFLFSYHLRNVFRGVTAYESKRKSRDMSNWKENFLIVFGTKWYYAILFPWVYSPFPKLVKLNNK